MGPIIFVYLQGIWGPTPTNPKNLTLGSLFVASTDSEPFQASLIPLCELELRTIFPVQAARFFGAHYSTSHPKGPLPIRFSVFFQ